MVAGVGACLSAVDDGRLYLAGYSIDRLYYGTDTRAQALLVGSFLGAVGALGGGISHPARADGPVGASAAVVGPVAGLAGAAYLVWAWHALSARTRFLYRGGFLLVALATAAVILTCVTCPDLAAAPVALRAPV